MSGFSNNTALRAVQLAFKAVFYVFKALWMGLTYGFRAYKNHKKEKQSSQVNNFVDRGGKYYGR